MSVIEGTSGWNGIHNVLLGLFGAAVFLFHNTDIYICSDRNGKSQKCVTGRAIWELL